MLVLTRVERLVEGGWFALLDPWLPRAEAEALFEALRDGVAWRQDKIKLFGNEHLQPRLSAWYGDPGAVYTYSGLTLAPEPWSAPLAALKARVEATCAELPEVEPSRASSPAFNSVLLNYYRSGADSMGFHADAEKELGPNPVIASVSLGAPRRFLLKPAGPWKHAPAIELDLGGGSLLVMGGTTQHHYRHGVPKQRGAGPRINLTFRRIFGPGLRAGAGA
ncbi:DNA methylase [Sorangium cellulosum]|uniref:DNA methylase n=1 Tax=Sorangium cellulosum TaxID=56 RepID=A0A2L0F6K2_SORCE|nr:alpha-ketoglutarate-dependent dioxygenase AlkB [Sorangium cellulosum]AUX47190.1 DNA methylase [Sorangium cellulosum]